jgi:hypothetical protein
VMVAAVQRPRGAAICGSSSAPPGVACMATRHQNSPGATQRGQGGGQLRCQKISNEERTKSAACRGRLMQFCKL